MESLICGVICNDCGKNIIISKPADKQRQEKNIHYISDSDTEIVQVPDITPAKEQK